MSRIDIDAALDRLLIKTKGELLSKIEQVSYNVMVGKTQTKAYCYMLKIDANGNIRHNDLIEFIDTKLVEYAIPKKDIDEAKDYMNETGSPCKIEGLRNKAKTLFTDLEKTGEGGEILLYILTQEFLKLPQLLSKMSLKTSGRLHYQGSDGIHVGFDKQNQNLNLYWGESKMYKNISNAISSCFESIKGFLLDAQGYSSTQERDLQLITSNINANVNDQDLENLLVRYFDKDDDFSNHIIYKGICFIGFDSDKYPQATDLSKTTDVVKQQIEQELNKWYELLNNGICKYPSLDLKEIHVFLMPFPSVKDFRLHFLQRFK
jgi:hypothetical protein